MIDLLYKIQLCCFGEYAGSLQRAHFQTIVSNQCRHRLRCYRSNYQLAENNNSWLAHFLYSWNRYNFRYFWYTTGKVPKLTTAFTTNIICLLQNWSLNANLFDDSAWQQTVGLYAASSFRCELWSMLFKSYSTPHSHVRGDSACHLLLIQWRGSLALFPIRIV